MELKALIDTLRNADIKLWLEAGQLRFSAPKGVMNNAYREQINQHRVELVELLQQTPLPQPEKISRDDNKTFLLSSAQKRLWFIDKLNNNRQSLDISSLLDIQGSLDISKLEQALNQLIEQHEILRCSFVQQGSNIVQSIQPAKAISLKAISGLGNIKQVEHFIAQNPISFDLNQGKLFACQLFQLAPEHFALYLSVHHIACDGHSLNLLAEELLNNYQSAALTNTATNTNSTYDYFDYSHWQQSIHSHQSLQRERSFWQKELSDCEALSLPSDFSRPKLASNQGESFYQHLDNELSQAIKTQALLLKTSNYHFLLAAYAVLLYRYSDQSHFAIGIPVSGRLNQQFENTIGCFINLLAIKIDIDGNSSFSQFCQNLQASCHQAYNHQTLPFEEVVDAISPTRNMASTPIFQTLFNHQQSHSQAQNMAGLSIKPALLEKTHSQYEIALQLNEDANGQIILEWQYRSDLFKPQRIKKLAESFIKLIKSVSTEAEQVIDRINLCSQTDIQQQQQRWMNSFQDYGEPQRIEALFSQQARKTPHATALSFGDETLSYQALEQQSNALALKLQKYQQAIIAIHLPRSIELCVSLLAVLKAGAAYLPLDSHLPKKRLAAIVNDANIKLLISQKKLATNLSDCFEQSSSAQTLWLDDFDINDKSTERPNISNSCGNKQQANELFNIIYTSGSTGTPKGVMVPHSAIFNRLMWMQQAFQLQRQEKVLFKTSFGFDVSVWEIFWPLLNGGQVVIAHKDGHKNPSYLSALINETSVNYCHFVPSMLSAFLQIPSISQCRSLKTVFCSGEVLKKSDVQAFYRELSDCQLYNLYGPTEAAIDVSFHYCTPLDKTIAIGKNIANTQLQLINRQGLLVPTGAIGEISIGGNNLAAGYLNKPELTDKAFIKNPLQQYGHPSAKLYLSGDLGFYDEQGNLHFVGRRDEQVKIRGFRVELQEIEASLMQHPALQDVFVRAIDTEHGDKQLVAYYMLRPNHSEEAISENEEAISAKTLQSFLQELLPRYMLPAHFIAVSQWPLLESGKKNIRALPTPAGIRQIASSYVAPRNEIEAKLADIWQALLHIDKISIYDNFFELGGHSLLAVQALNQGQQAFNINLAVSDILQNPTIAATATAIKQAQVQQRILSQHDQADDDEEIIL